MIFFVSGVHLALVGLLISERTLCWPCVTTAAAALAAAGYLLVRLPTSISRASLLAVLGALAGTFGLAVALRFTAATQQRLAFAAALAVLPGYKPSVPGHVELVILARPDCRYCAALKAGPLPEVERMFGEQLEVREQAPPSPQTPTPTLIAIGCHAYVLAGYHDAAALEKLLHLALDPAKPQNLPASAGMLVR